MYMSSMKPMKTDWTVTWKNYSYPYPYSSFNDAPLTSSIHVWIWLVKPVHPLLCFFSYTILKFIGINFCRLHSSFPRTTRVHPSTAQSEHSSGNILKSVSRIVTVPNLERTMIVTITSKINSQHTMLWRTDSFYMQPSGGASGNGYSFYSLSTFLLLFHFFHSWCILAPSNARVTSEIKNPTAQNRWTNDKINRTKPKTNMYR